MVLRFEVNQAEAFRRGVDVSKSTNHLNIDPSQLSQEERDLIADRLRGIDVMKMVVQDGKIQQSTWENDRITAILPTYESLLEAIKQNQSEVEAEVKPKGKQ
jgi:hypothetical protein